ncbi:unnamed protein product [Discula destructiva]
MVQLVEVEDEHFQHRQAGPDEDEGDYTDTDSEISNDSDYDPRSETLAERLWALRDIVPPSTRSWFSGKFATTKRVVTGVLFFAGRATWSLSVSALLLGVPFALAWAEEQQMIAMEQEMRQREQGQDLLTAGGAGGELGAGGSTADMLGVALEKDGAAVQAKPAL